MRYLLSLGPSSDRSHAPCLHPDVVEIVFYFPVVLAEQGFLSEALTLQLGSLPKKASPGDSFSLCPFSSGGGYRMMLREHERLKSSLFEVMPVSPQNL